MTYRQLNVLLCAVVLLLIAPLFWSHSGKIIPQIFTGDEPHYLITIHSLIEDGDLDLTNNYRDVHSGGIQAGKNFAGAAIDHHTVWFDHGQRRNWADIYEVEPPNFDTDAAGKPVPRVRENQPSPLNHPEYSTHPPGLALILSPILLPLRSTEFVEPAAIICATLGTIVAFLLFVSFLTKYTDRQTAIFAGSVTFLGTPIWHYGRTLFSEPYLLLFSVASYTFALKYSRPFLSGALIALGILMKPPFALLALPLIGVYLLESKIRSLMIFSLSIAFGVATLLSLNALMFGTPFAASQAWQQGSVIRGVGGIIFSLRYGLLMTAPAIVVAAICWPTFLRIFPRDAIVIASAAALYFIMVASWRYWNGATAYSARLIVPVLPFIFVSIVVLPRTPLWRRPFARRATLLICITSVIIGGFAAIPNWRNWDTNPVLRLAQFVTDYPNR